MYNNPIMTRQNGFIPLLVLILGAISITAATASYSYFHNKPKNTQNNITVFETPTPALSPSATPTLIIVKTEITKSPKIPIQVKSSVIFSISDNGAAILDPNLNLNIKDENTGKEQKLQNTGSSWTVNNIPQGIYRFYINFPQERYFNPEKNCEGCKNKEDLSNFDTCGYKLQINEGENVKISCMLRSTRPLSNQINSPQPASDTIPPNTNIYYPQQNGSITYKTDGK